jgi:hypothetical protein
MTSPTFVRRIRANAIHLTSLVRAVPGREYRTLDPEWPNFLQAIHYGLQHPEALAETAGLWAALIGFVESRGLFGPWQQITVKVAAQLEALPDGLACQVANEAGFFLQKVREYPLDRSRCTQRRCGPPRPPGTGSRLRWRSSARGIPG